MKIKVFAPAFYDLSKVVDGYLDIDNDATVDDAFNMLKIDDQYKKILIALVNYERVKLSKTLRDGDTLNIIGPVNGG